MKVVNKLIEEHQLNKEECLELLSLWQNGEVVERLKQEAVRIREENFSKKIYTRGLIEFTNYCRNDCYYCGIQRSNKAAIRYRLTKEEILDCCETGYQVGLRTFVLQGGEDAYFTDDRMVDIIAEIRNRFPDCAITLSVGEKTLESYTRLKEAGADRYLLRHETANEYHYRNLHPENLKLSHRMQCLYNLKKAGFQVGAGFMVGSPGQTLECLADDLMFLQELRPEMIGIGPFIPHHDTRFKEEPAGSVDMTVFLLSVLRILFPKVLLPATTALGSLAPDGRERGFLAGANVVMPNLSPQRNRENYSLYDNKLSSGAEAAEGYLELQKKVREIGYEIVCERGDYPEI